MALLWREEYSIGLEIIDKQHRKFIEILNKLSESFVAKQKKEIIVEVFDELERYIQSHFEFEEKYFAEFHYIHAEEHRKQHEQFYEEVQELKRKFEAGDNELQYVLFEFMEAWVRTHVLKEDKQYVQCFKEHGLK